MRAWLRAALIAAATTSLIGFAAPAAQAADLQVTAFGATPNDTTDDTAAIQQALNTVAPGQVLNFPAGTYRHSGILRANVAGSILYGPTATLQATNEATSAFDVNANNVLVDSLTFTTPTTTQRWTTPDQHKVTVIGQTGVALLRVKVAGSAGAGIFIENSSDFHLTDTDVRTTRADGLHITGGSHHGDSVRHRSTFTGDDGVAVVSYANNGLGMCHDITINDPIVTGNNWGRGVSVVGGEDITYNNVTSEDSAGAGIYIGAEGNYDTLGTQRVQINGAKVTRANQNTTIGHGAILVTNTKAAATVTNIALNDVIVSGTRATAPGNIRATVSNGATMSNIRWTNVSITGGPTAGYQGDAPSGSQIFTNVTKDGAQLTAP